MAWPGGKDGAGVAQRLINQIPPHDVFISAFLGDCAIMRRKLPAARNIGIDASRENIDRWLATSRLPNLELYCCDAIQWLKHEFGLYLVAPPKTAAVDRHARSAAARKMAASAAAAENSVAGSRSCPRSPPASPFSAAENGGQGLRFVYLDPPYLIQSRRSGRRIFRHELSDDQHAELLDVTVRLPCPVMISHYPHQLYSVSLRDWRSFTFQSQTRGGKPATEQVWCNYDEPAELHDARFVGGNKRERERVRRRVRNWLGGLDRMQPAERQAILDAIASRHLPRLRIPPPD